MRISFIHAQFHLNKRTLEQIKFTKGRNINILHKFSNNFFLWNITYKFINTRSSDWLNKTYIFLKHQWRRRRQRVENSIATALVWLMKFKAFWLQQLCHEYVWQYQWFGTKDWRLLLPDFFQVLQTNVLQKCVILCSNVWTNSQPFLCPLSTSTILMLIPMNICPYLRQFICVSYCTSEIVLALNMFSFLYNQNINLTFNHQHRFNLSRMTSNQVVKCRIHCCFHEDYNN